MAEISYNGAERRKGPRRIKSNRRVDVRFELDDGNRRKDCGRRLNDSNVTNIRLV